MIFEMLFDEKASCANIGNNEINLDIVACVSRITCLRFNYSLIDLQIIVANNCASRFIVKKSFIDLKVCILDSIIVSCWYDIDINFFVKSILIRKLK